MHDFSALPKGISFACFIFVSRDPKVLHKSTFTGTETSYAFGILIFTICSSFSLINISAGGSTCAKIFCRDHYGNS